MDPTHEDIAFNCWKIVRASSDANPYDSWQKIVHGIAKVKSWRELTASQMNQLQKNVLEKYST